MKSGFMKYAYAEGTVKTKLHEKWININGFSFNVTSNGLQNLSTDGLKHHANFSSVTITKLADRSSVGLLAASCEGKIDASQTQIDFGEMHDDNMTVTESYLLKDSHIQSFSKSVSLSGEDLEHIVMGFSSIHITYTEYDEKGQAKNKIDYEHKTENMA